MTKDAVAIPGFTHFQWPASTSIGELSFPVYTTGDGPAIILLHELPHIDEVLCKTALTFIDDGFSIFMPSLLGTPLAERSQLSDIAMLAKICVRAEFAAVFSNGQAPITEWLHSLISHCASLAPKHPSVGLIGLCFSGGFALAGAVHPAVTGAVACEPSLPFIGKSNTGISKADERAIEIRTSKGEVHLRAFRFDGDTLSPCERMLALKKRFGAGIEVRCLPDDSAAPAKPGRVKHHSVITHHLINAPTEPTFETLKYIQRFFHWRLEDPLDEPPLLNIPRASDCMTKGNC